MKSNTVTLFLSTGIVMEIPRLSDKKLKKLNDIIEVKAGPESGLRVREVYHSFKHEGSRYFIKPCEVALYVLKSEKVRI